MPNPNCSYEKSIDSLIFDPVSEVNAILKTENDLNLWTTAQFACTGESLGPSSQHRNKTDGSSSNSSTSDVELEELLSYLNPDLHHNESQQDYVTTPRCYEAASPNNSNNRLRQPLLLPKLPPELLKEALMFPAPMYSLEGQNMLGESTETISVEEEKRRRNTAASARFRIKKKIKEQDLKRSIREMTTKSDVLHSRAYSLEKEIEWLRGILTKKGSNSL